MSNVPTGCMFFIARSHIAARGVLTLAIGIASYFDNFSGVPLVVFFGVSLLHDNSSIVVGVFRRCIEVSCTASKI